MAENAEATQAPASNLAPGAFQKPPAQPSIEERISAAISTDAEAIPKEEEVAGESAPEGTEAEAAPETAPEQEQDEQAGEDVETIEVETLADLAEYIGADKADLYNIQVDVTTPDGTPERVSLGEWKDGYQASRKLAAEQQKAAEAYQQFEAERAQAQAQLVERLELAGKMAEAAETQLATRMQAVDWNQLRMDDPAEYAARRQEFLDSEAQLNNLKQQIGQERAQAQAEAAERQQAQLGQHLQAQRAQMLARPVFQEWSDPAKAQEGGERLAKYLAMQGFNDRDVGTISHSDHRIVEAFEKARLYDEKVSKVEPAKKKVVRLQGKVLKPGAKQTPADTRGSELEGLRARIKQSGKVDDLAAYLSATNRSK